MKKKKAEHPSMPMLADNVSTNTLSLDNEEGVDLQDIEDKQEILDYSTVSEEKKEQKFNDIFEAAIDHYTRLNSNFLIEVRRGIMSKDEFLEVVQKDYLQKYHEGSEALFDELISQMNDFLFGYYKLTELIDDPDISDIAVIAFDNIQVKKGGVNMPSDVKFETKSRYEQFVAYVASKNQIDISNINAIQIFTDRVNSEKYIMRFSIVMPLLTSTGSPYLSIRKTAKDFPEMESLQEAKMISEEQRKYLEEKVKTSSMIICGASASGKTTLLNALKEEIEHSDSCLVVQESEELSQKNHPYMLFEHPTNIRGEGKVNYTLYDIVAAGLVMNINYFIVGEIKGGEAIHLLNAAYTGHRCLTTIHAQSAQNALDKMTDYAKYKSDYRKDELMKMLTSFDIVVHMEGYKVKEICEITGWDADKKEPIYKTIVFNGKG